MHMCVHACTCVCMQVHVCARLSMCVQSQGATCKVRSVGGGGCRPRSRDAVLAQLQQCHSAGGSSAAPTLTWGWEWG